MFNNKHFLVILYLVPCCYVDLDSSYFLWAFEISENFYIQTVLLLQILNLA